MLTTLPGKKAKKVPKARSLRGSNPHPRDGTTQMCVCVCVVVAMVLAAKAAVCVGDGRGGRWRVGVGVCV